MINKIKKWLFFKYGVEVKSRLIWLVLILIASLLVLIPVLLANRAVNQGSWTKTSRPNYAPNFDPLAPKI